MNVQFRKGITDKLKWAIPCFKYGSGLFLLGFVLIFLGNYWVVQSSSHLIYEEIDDLPCNEVGLVLGTSKRLKGGHKNPYFTNRIDAAANLYHQGKVNHLLVSGDNRYVSYNEPREMLRALIEKGVPESDITMDFAGFRTLDSVVRAKKVFQEEKITIISQEFHNQRALFIANYYGMEALAFNAKPVSIGLGWKVMAREYLARCKAILDLYILKKGPKFLGEKIDIPTP